MIRVICDRCGIDIVEHLCRGCGIDIVESSCRISVKEKPFDLCEICMGLLVRFLNQEKLFTSK